MVDNSRRMLELASCGFGCSQIMMIMALESDGKDNEDLVKAMNGLTMGMGEMGKACGVLTGGCCIISLFTGKGKADEIEESQQRDILQEYVKWFENTVGRQYGGCDCSQIIKGDRSKCFELCTPMIENGYEKVMGLLYESGVMN